MLERDGLEITGHGDAQLLADPVEVLGMHGVEPDRGRNAGAEVSVSEQLDAPPRVVDGVGRQIPIPQPVVRRLRPQDVPLLAPSDVVDQVLLFERGCQQCSPLVVCLASIVREGINLTRDSQ